MAPVIPAIVLAAGRSSRMGRAKAALGLGRGKEGKEGEEDTFLTCCTRANG